MKRDNGLLPDEGIDLVQLLEKFDRPKYVFGEDIGYTISVLAIPVVVLLFFLFVLIAFLLRKKGKIYIFLFLSLAFSTLLLLLPFLWYRYDLNNVETNLPTPLYQTCFSAPNSEGCEACKKYGKNVDIQKNDYNPNGNDENLCGFCEVSYLEYSKSAAYVPKDEFNTKCKSLKVNLIITRQLWSGWTPGNYPKETETYDLSKSQSITLEGMNSYESFKLKIIEISSENIKLEVKGIAIENSDSGGIDLLNCDKSKQFSVAKGESVKLRTCTMDGGATWTLEY